MHDGSGVSFRYDIYLDEFVIRYVEYVRKVDALDFPETLRVINLSPTEPHVFYRNYYYRPVGALASAISRSCESMPSKHLHGSILAKYSIKFSKLQTIIHILAISPTGSSHSHTGIRDSG